jgi:hypothetical protein
MEDLDSVGFDIHEDADFQGSDSNGVMVINLAIVDQFAFVLSPGLVSAAKDVKAKKNRQGAFFSYLLKFEYQTPLLIDTLGRLQIFAEGSNLAFREDKPVNYYKPDVDASNIYERCVRQYEHTHQKHEAPDMSDFELNVNEIKPMSNDDVYELRYIDNQWVIVDKREPIKVDNCFIHAIKQQGASNQMVQEARLMKGKAIEIKDVDIDRIAKAFGIYVIIHEIIHDCEGYKHKSNRSRCYGIKLGADIKTYKLVRYKGHYFTLEQTPFTKYYIDNMLSNPIVKPCHIKEGNRIRRAPRDRYYLNSEELVSILFDMGAFRPMTVAELIQYKAYDN